MRSLRAQFLALVVAAVLATLTLLALYGSHSARQVFRATVERQRMAPAVSLVAGRLDSAYAQGGWGAIRALIGALPATEPGDSLRRPGHLVVTTRGEIIAAEDPALLQARATLGAGPRVQLERTEGRNTAILVVAPGQAIRAPAGDTVGYLFTVPGNRVDLADPERAFASGFNRPLWIGAAVLLLAASLLALGVTGRLVAPIHRLTDAVNRVSQGDYGARVGQVRVTELAPLGAAVDGLAEALERSEAERRRMIRDVAHELRTPLTNVRGQIEALQDRLLALDDAALASLYEEVRLLERLVTDLAELARADAGQLDANPTPLELGPEVARAVEGFVRSARLPAGHVTIDVPSGLRVRADRERLAQILRNLLENAVTHAGPGAPITVSAAALDGLAAVSVCDGGVGIAPEHLGRVGERLYRPDPSRARGSGGAGLGLAIVKALVAAQGGAVTVTSRLGEGTRVRFTLPLDLPASA